MSIYGRAVRGAEAGVIAAGALEVSFFILDLIRLQPLATAVSLSGVGWGGLVLDLTSLTGVFAALWATYQILTLTFMHFLAFGLVGVVASLLFDWTRPGGAARLAVVAAFCTAAFYGTVALSSSVVALDSVGAPLVVGMNLLAAVILGGSLRLVSIPKPEDEVGVA